ncbi:MAG: 30S ribosomal protein S2 [Deltaproteobacteria bacterium]|nr:30S ribosomal protein S2 [Deltaproteobacteria bacterium]
MNQAENSAANTPNSTEYPVEISIQSLMKAGAHFGHQTDKWNPQMSKYIYAERSGLHIINLDLTLDAWKRARKAILNVTSTGGSVLFVGTKRQAREVIEEESKRSNSFFVTNRWLGGTLTNFSTIKKSIDRIKKLTELLEKANDAESEVRLNKKEQLKITRDLEKLEASLGGIKDLKGLPGALFVTDINRESIAIEEAKKLHIPVIALADTNSNPGVVDYAIPSNDDGVRTLRIFSAAVADAAIEGATIFKERFESAKETKTQEASESKKKPKAEVKETASEEAAPAA